MGLRPFVQLIEYGTLEKRKDTGASGVNSLLMLHGWLHPTLSWSFLHFIVISCSDHYVSASATEKWAQLAITWYSFELGNDSEQVQEMREVAVKPQTHRAWGTREVMEVGAS
jgi:hypothetical protein